jgi:hypothetical protein
MLISLFLLVWSVRTTINSFYIQCNLLWSPFRCLVGSCYSIFSFMCMFCRSLFVLLSFFLWPSCCLFFFDIYWFWLPLWYLQTLLIKNKFTILWSIPLGKLQSLRCRHVWISWNYVVLLSWKEHVFLNHFQSN